MKRVLITSDHILFSEKKWADDKSGDTHFSMKKENGSNLNSPCSDMPAEDGVLVANTQVNPVRFCLAFDVLCGEQDSH
jgi:hypothetical protein